MKQIVENALPGYKPDQVFKPIDFMLLDYQMPKKTGIQVVMEAREYFKKTAQTYDKLDEPVYVFLTAFATPSFKKHLKESLDVRLVYEKPIHLEQLKIIFEQNTWSGFILF